MRPATRRAYRRQWKKFRTFLATILGCSSALPATTEQVMIFGSQLFREGKKHATILNYLSAIAFFHKTAGLPDPTDTFLLRKFMVGIKNLTGPQKQLNPISDQILYSLILALQHPNYSPYETLLWSAMMATMYYACLRIGEAAVSQSDDHTLRLSQISFLCVEDSPPTSVLVRFLTYKHSKGKKAKLCIKQSLEQNYCPVLLLWKYCAARPHSENTHLFLTQGGLPVTRTAFVRVLKEALTRTPYQGLNINSHSFRVGRTTDMVIRGQHSEEYIRQVGRWSSDAFRKYIRPLVITG